MGSYFTKGKAEQATCRGRITGDFVKKQTIIHHKQARSFQSFTYIDSYCEESL